MKNVVFVVPFVLDATLRFVRAMAAIPGVRMTIVSQEPAERLPSDVRRSVAAVAFVRDALDPDLLTDAVRTAARAMDHRVDALVGILEPLQEALAQVRERLGIRGMDERTARNFRDKARMKEVLAEHGLPCARHELARSTDEALEFGRRAGYPLVVKPPAGAGAKSTFRVDDEAQLRRALTALPPAPRRPLLLEEFIVGREFSFDSVTLAGEARLHSISCYTPGPLEVLQQPWIQWTVLLPRDVSGTRFDPIREAGPRALAALGMVTGMTHMEWFERPDGSIAISEVAARPPGAQFTSLIGYAHDRDFYRAWAELMVFERFEPPARRWAVGAAFLRGQGHGVVAAVHGLEEAQQELGSLVVEARLPRRGQAPAGSYEGEGFVIVRHQETEVVERALQRLVTLLRVELAPEANR